MSAPKSRSHRAAVLLLIASAWFAPLPAHAQLGGGADFALDSEDWNGLSDLVWMLERAGARVQTEGPIDLDALDPSEPLFLVHPTVPLPAADLARFVADGGKILLADDVGEGAELMDRFHLTRLDPAPGALPHADYLADNPALPRLRARGTHPLLDGVRTVVANHPALLLNVGGPVLAYDDDGGFAYDMNLGRGKAIVLADSSVLINHMLGVADNARFARNAARYLCAEADPCVVHLRAGAIEFEGSWEGDGPSAPWSADIASWNEALRDAARSIPLADLLYALGLIAAFGIAAYLGGALGPRAPRPYSAALLAGAASAPPQSEFDWNLARYVSASRGMNYALPLSILKENFEELFLRALHAWPDEPGEERLPIAALVDRYAARYLDLEQPAGARRERAQLESLLRTLATVPTRHKVYLDADAYFSERDLLRIHASAMRVLDRMGLKEIHERRTYDPGDAGRAAQRGRQV